MKPSSEQTRDTSQNTTALTMRKAGPGARRYQRPKTAASITGSTAPPTRKTNPTTRLRRTGPIVTSSSTLLSLGSAGIRNSGTPSGWSAVGTVMTERIASVIDDRERVEDDLDQEPSHASLARPNPHRSCGNALRSLLTVGVHGA